jgi:hypothetical protein
MNQIRSATAVLLATGFAAYSGLAHAQMPGGAPPPPQEQVSPPAEGYAAAPAVPKYTVEHATFGQHGHLVITNDLGFSIGYSHLGTTPSANTFNLNLRPAVDFFIIDNLSLGVYTIIDWTHVSTGGVGGHNFVFSLGGRVGYNIWLMDRISVWPRLGLSYSLHSVTGASTSSLALNLSAPFLYHVENFFFGLSPELDVDLTGNDKTTAIAGVLEIGAWF